MSSLCIRTFGPADEPAVIALWDRCGLTRPWNDPHKDVERKLRDSPELFLVGEVDGRIVTAAMVGYDGHRGWIQYLGVDPDHQRQGIGRAIVEEAERRLRILGCPKINLQVRTTNTAVIEFYRRLGFQLDDVVSLGKRLEKDEQVPRSERHLVALSLAKICRSDRGTCVRTALTKICRSDRGTY